MKKKVVLTTSHILWMLFILNIILLLYAIFDKGICYLVSSLLWSLGLLRYHSKAIREDKKTIINTFPKDGSVKVNRHIEYESDNI